MITFETIAVVLWRLQLARQKMRTEVMKTMMAPSSSESEFSCGSNQASHCNHSVISMTSGNDIYQSTSNLSSQRIVEQLQPREDEPNLYNLPSTVHPEYKPLPVLLKLLLGYLSIVASSKINHSKKIIKLKLVLKILSTFLLSMTFVQDLFYSPSRIATKTLLQNQWLPSPLSKYSIISTSVPTQGHQDESNLIMNPIGVHFLELKYDGVSNASNSVEYKFDAIHFNHGFGASSLSWLPAIPSLIQKIGGKIGIAHDAPGFGFTDRPAASGKDHGLVPFSSAGNAALGNALVMKQIRTCKQSHAKKVALFGHSMGCASTLKMGLMLPPDVEKTIVLVAPALVGSLRNRNEPSSPRMDHSKSSLGKATKKKKSIQEIILSQPTKIQNTFIYFIAALRRLILDPLLMYILKRAVGQPKFWSRGLRAVWGDPKKLSDTDVLRFQWHSIGKGWENGLLAFTRSRLFSICPYTGGELQLLEDVANTKNTKVIIVAGTNDPVVPFGMVKKIAESVGDVQFVQIDGAGHDPFEEDVEQFVTRINELL